MEAMKEDLQHDLQHARQILHSFDIEFQGEASILRASSNTDFQEEACILQATNNSPLTLGDFLCPCDTILLGIVSFLNS